MKLSPAQIEVLLHLAQSGETIAYFTGGWWTLPSIGSKQTPWRGKWTTTPGTLKALAQRGLIMQIDRCENYPIDKYPQLADFTLTAQGLREVENHIASQG
jgi:hypothetical protein